MKIESIIRRPDGTIVTMNAPTRTYHFKPENHPEDPHIAFVDVESHARTLLRITEGYRLVEGEEGPQAGQDPVDEVALKGSAIHYESYNIHGETVTLDELVSLAFDDAGLTPEQWNALPDQDRYAHIDATLKDMLSEPTGETLEPQGGGAGEVVGDAGGDAGAGDAGAGNGNGHADGTDQAEGQQGTAGTQPKPATSAGSGVSADALPLNQRPMSELKVLFEKATKVKPSKKMTIADLVAGIEAAGDN